MSLIPFPTRELFEQELPSFDLIVLQNFEFRPTASATYLENIRSYVEGGGGLVMLGGAAVVHARAGTRARRWPRRCRSSWSIRSRWGRSSPGPRAAHRARARRIR